MRPALPNKDASQTPRMREADLWRKSGAFSSRRRSLIFILRAMEKPGTGLKNLPAILDTALALAGNVLLLTLQGSKSSFHNAMQKTKNSNENIVNTQQNWENSKNCVTFNENSSSYNTNRFLFKSHKQRKFQRHEDGRQTNTPSIVHASPQLHLKEHPDVQLFFRTTFFPACSTPGEHKPSLCMQSSLRNLFRCCWCSDATS